MPRFALSSLLLVAQIAAAQDAVPSTPPASSESARESGPGQAPALATVQASVPARVLTELDVQGGTEDDRDFARAALGFRPGDPVDESGYRLALEAVRVTDRFQSVEGSLEEPTGGLLAKLRVIPWPGLEKWEIHAALPRALRKDLFLGVRKGIQMGDLRIQRWQTQAQQKLKESGYPGAQVTIRREDGGKRLVIAVDTGIPSLVRSLVIEGDPFPYTPDRLKSVTGIRVGKSLWNANLRRMALDRLRQRFIKNKRFVGHTDFRWNESTGELVLKVEPGPVVRVEKEGTWSIWWKNLEEFLPLSRAERYDPEILDEGDRRIIRYLRGLGYLDAVVSHRQEVLKGTPEKPLEVKITYVIQSGLKTRIDALRFENNRDISEEELIKAAALPSGIWSLGAPPATPGLIGNLEDRIKALYWSQGYPDVVVRRPPSEHSGGKTGLVFNIKEGNHRFLDRIVLDVPAGPSWQPWILAECLTQVFSDVPVLENSSEANTQIYRSNRPSMKGVTVRILEERIPTKRGVQSFTLTSSRPLPFIKNDIAQVFSALRQRLATLGVERPLPRFSAKQGESGTVVYIEVPVQPRLKVRRIVVQGVDRTRSRAVFREMQMESGSALDPERLSKTQAGLSDLGAFSRIDMESIANDPEYGTGLPWQKGDLLLRTSERPPWVVSSSFGYDKNQGYHLGLGLQRINFMGMGRTLDFGIRAGDTTLHNPTLRKWFPTGEYNRSLDSYSMAYTDPWFLPGSMSELLSARTQYRIEGAYIEDLQTAFLAHRRRVLNTFEWKVGQTQMMQVGHRFDRTDLASFKEGISRDDLLNFAGVPGDHTVISAPFVQMSVDKRDRPFDPTRGTYFSGRVDLANQLFGTGGQYSFVKLDLRQQWNWSFGYQASGGVLMAAVRVGLARPTTTSATDLPLTERFFAGGPFTVRGVEPNFLGPTHYARLYDQSGKEVKDDSGNPKYQLIPVGGQGLVVCNLEYRFPLFGSQSIWAEIFVDAGQVYAKLNPASRHSQLPSGSPDPEDPAPFPPLRVTPGLGLIFKVGFPIKIEYAADLKRILGRPRNEQERDTQLKSILISAGFQF